MNTDFDIQERTEGNVHYIDFHHIPTGRKLFTSYHVNFPHFRETLIRDGMKHLLGDPNPAPVKVSGIIPNSTPAPHAFAVREGKDWVVYAWGKIHVTCADRASAEYVADDLNGWVDPDWDHLESYGDYVG